MPSKIQLDENLVFLYICLQKSDMKTIDFAAVGQTTNLKSPAARMRYTRLKRQIEKGVIGANANINLGSGSDEREGNGEEKERRKEKREKKMREKKQKEEKRVREGVEKKEKVEAKEWNRVEDGMGMKMYGGVDKKEGKRKREIGDTTESDAGAISEPDFQVQGWKDFILNNTTSPFAADPPPFIPISTNPHTEYPSHPYLHNYPATSAPQTNIPQSDFQKHNPAPKLSSTNSPPKYRPLPHSTPQIKHEPYSPFSSFSSYSTERSIPNVCERPEDEDADSEDEMPLAKRRGLGKRHTNQSQSQSPNGNLNPNPSREEISRTDASKIAEGYSDAHSRSYSHSCSEMRDPRQSGCADEHTYTHPPLRSSTHESGSSSQYAYANPYTIPYKSIYAPPASSHETLESLDCTPLTSLPLPSSSSPSLSPSLISPSKSTSTPSNPPSNPPSHPHPYNWADTYQSYRHLWGTERIARVSPPPLPPPISTSSSLPLPLYHNHNHNHNYTHSNNHNNIANHNANANANANTIPDSDFSSPLPNESPRSNSHLSLSQW